MLYFKLDAEKRKAAVKLRKSQKRRALGDLFDTLKQEGEKGDSSLFGSIVYFHSKLGLSYRKGADLKKDFYSSSFNLPYQQLPTQL